MKTLKKITVVLLSAAILFSLTACASDPAGSAAGEGPSRKTPTRLLDYVIDIGTYTELDYKTANDTLDSYFDGWGGMCSAAAVIDENGDMTVGRNYDFIVSESPVYVYRTRIDGCYETLSMTYNYVYGPGYDFAMQGGISKDVYAVVPFMAEDVLNSQGLYIETNMRNGERENGSSKFGCWGTNHDSDQRVCALALPQYIGLNCATVEEAVEYVKGLDVYTMNGSGFDWNLCFLLADASGHYGVLELARNKVSWLDQEPIQTNFYITPEFNAAEDFKCGTGRYDLLKENLSSVHDKASMFDLMEQVRYSFIYHPEESPYDVRSEYVGDPVDGFGEITYEQIMDDANYDAVMSYIDESRAEVEAMTREQSQYAHIEWESTYTLVVNCTQKTISARFFEDDTQTLELAFE